MNKKCSSCGKTKNFLSPAFRLIQGKEYCVLCAAKYINSGALPGGAFNEIDNQAVNGKTGALRGFVGDFLVVLGVVVMITIVAGGMFLFQKWQRETEMEEYMRQERAELMTKKAECKKAVELLGNLYRVKGKEIFLSNPYCENAQIFKRHEDKILCLTGVSIMEMGGETKYAYDACMDGQGVEKGSQ